MLTRGCINDREDRGAGSAVDQQRQPGPRTMRTWRSSSRCSDRSRSGTPRTVPLRSAAGAAASFWDGWSRPAAGSYPSRCWSMISGRTPAHSRRDDPHLRRRAAPGPRTGPSSANPVPRHRDRRYRVRPARRAGTRRRPPLRGHPPGRARPPRRPGGPRAGRSALVVAGRAVRRPRRLRLADTGARPPGRTAPSSRRATRPGGARPRAWRVPRPGAGGVGDRAPVAGARLGPAVPRSLPSRTAGRCAGLTACRTSRPAGPVRTGIGGRSRPPRT